MMVVKGNYSVKIINAKTRKQLREHTSYTGKVYTIIDPNESYLLKLEVLGDADDTQDESGVLLWKIFINGKSSSIGYAYPNSSSRSKCKRNASRSCSYLGLNGMGSANKCQIKIGSATSIIPARYYVKSRRHHTSGTNTMMTNVTVDIYECISTQHRKSAAVANRKASSRNLHQQGKLLDSVTLLCCFSASAALPSLKSMYLDSSYSSPIATQYLWNGLWNGNESLATTTTASYYWNHHVNVTAPASPTGAVTNNTSDGMKPAIKI